MWWDRGSCFLLSSSLYSHGRDRQYTRTHTHTHARSEDSSWVTVWFQFQCVVFPHRQAMLGPQVGCGGVVPGAGWQARTLRVSVGLERGSDLVGAIGRCCRSFCRRWRLLCAFLRRPACSVKKRASGQEGKLVTSVRMGEDEAMAAWSRDGGEGMDSDCRWGWGCGGRAYLFILVQRTDEMPWR